MGVRSKGSREYRDSSCKAGRPVSFLSRNELRWPVMASLSLSLIFEVEPNLLHVFLRHGGAGEAGSS